MTEPRIIAVVPVRMGSTRLPGKTLMPIGSKPLLGHLLDRLGQCQRLSSVVVATSEKPENDAIETYCHERATACFRGAEDDVLARLLGALEAHDADVGVVTFGDAPLVDPQIVDDIVGRFVENGTLDFVGNDLATTYPPGMEVEVFSIAALRDSAQRTDDPAIREHGTLFIRQNPEIYNILNIEASGSHHRPELEIEVDTPEDAVVITAIADHFEGRTDFTLGEIIAFLDSNPELRASNQEVPRRWKQFRDEPR